MLERELDEALGSPSRRVCVHVSRDVKNRVRSSRGREGVCPYANLGGTTSRSIAFLMPPHLVFSQPSPNAQADGQSGQPCPAPLPSPALQTWVHSRSFRMVLLPPPRPGGAGFLAEDQSRFRGRFSQSRAAHQLSRKGARAVPNPGKSEGASSAGSYLIFRRRWRESE